MAVIWATSAGAPPRQRSGLCARFLLGIQLARSFEQSERGEIEEAGGAQLVEARELAQAVEAKMHEKAGSRSPQERPARAGAPALGADPTGLHQRIYSPLAEGNASDL